MDAQTLRFQCLQLANQALQFTGQPGSTQPKPDEIMALADKLYTWVKG